jgi:hypothetical protein
VLGLIRIHPVLDRREVPLYFLESVLHHEMLHHHLGGVPDRSGRTGLPLARLPRGRGAVLAPPGRAQLGEGEPAVSAEGQPAAAEAAPQQVAPARAAVARLAPQLRRLLPYLRRHQRGLALGIGCLLATTALSVAGPWVLRYAIDDLTLGITRSQADRLRRADRGAGAGRGAVPLRDAA